MYVCTNCSYESNLKSRVCPGCGEVDPWSQVSKKLQKQRAKEVTSGKTRMAQRVNKVPKQLSMIEARAVNRIVTPVTEFNRVLGGGIVPGSILLFGGEPGRGKSTLMLQLAAALSRSEKVLYIGTEENEGQIALRAERLELSYVPENLYVLNDNNVDEINERHLPSIKPDYIVVDSINHIYSPDNGSAPNSPTQMRNTILFFQEYAKSHNVAVLCIAQVNSDGTIAGRKEIEHIVDAVFYLEGMQNQAYRILRSQKNRFGAENEIGVFEMTGRGLVEVTNPSASMLDERSEGCNGSALAIVMNGIRPLFVDIQALVQSSPYMSPRRQTIGIPKEELEKVAAIINKHLEHVSLTDEDIFVTVPHGLRVAEPAVDLAMAAAIISSYLGEPVTDTGFAGELSLNGDILSVSDLEIRLKEAAKLGYENVVTRLRKGTRIPEGLTVHNVHTVQEFCDVVFGDRIKELSEKLKYDRVEGDEDE